MTMYLRLRISYCGTMVLMCRGGGGGGFLQGEQSGVFKKYLHANARMHSRSCKCSCLVFHISVNGTIKVRDPRHRLPLH